MHDAVVVVTVAQGVDQLRLFDLKLVPETRVDVLVQNVHVMVSIGSRVLVEHAQGVQDLVQHQLKLPEAAGQGDALRLCDLFTDKRPTPVLVTESVWVWLVGVACGLAILPSILH